MAFAQRKKLRISTIVKDVGYVESKIDLLEMGRQFDYGLIRKLAKYYNVDIKFMFE